MDLEAHREAVIGEQHRCRAIFSDTDFLQYFDRAPRGILFDNPSALDQKQEGRGTPIHDRHFAAIELDNRIVDRGARQRRHQVLDRAHRISLAVG